MKRWRHSSEASSSSNDVTASEKPKLKRTSESGHSYDGDITFENSVEMLKWCEEDELYED